MSPVWVAFICGAIVGFSTSVCLLSLLIGKKQSEVIYCRCDESNQGCECKVCDHV